ncbi:MAG: OmpH family outer membrane protein [Pirellulaceae bacterium]
MKRRIFAIIVGAIALATNLSSTHAQQRDIVAVLDVAKVFNENLEFDTQMQRIRDEADQLKNTIQQEQDGIRNDAMRLQDMPVGSAERNSLEATLEQKQAALRTKARQAETDLLTKEAQLYYKTYQKMQQVVAQLSETNSIGLVLRFDSTPIDKDNRQEVIMGVNRAVVYHYQLDLTKLVIEAMGPVVAKNDNGTNLK